MKFRTNRLWLKYVYFFGAICFAIILIVCSIVGLYFAEENSNNIIDAMLPVFGVSVLGMPICLVLFFRERGKEIERINHLFDKEQLKRIFEAEFSIKEKYRHRKCEQCNAKIPNGQIKCPSCGFG